VNRSGSKKEKKEEKETMPSAFLYVRRVEILPRVELMRVIFEEKIVVNYKIKGRLADMLLR